MSNAKNNAIETLCDGSIKAIILKNEDENGVFFSVRFSRTDKDDNCGPQDTCIFSVPQLLTLSNLAHEAYFRASKLLIAEQQNES